MILTLARPVVTFVVLIGAWWAATRLASIPFYLLPQPPAVLHALWQQRVLLASATLTTFSEMALGLVIGTILGSLCALAMAFSPRLQRWIMPLLLLSQAIPAFALAPLLVLWFGFGMASKVVMATIVIFFPVAAAFSDGLRHTDPGWMDLAHTMGASPGAILRHVRLPAAMPAFGSGLRVATAIAPIGAIVGEWVGASAGLGYVMLNANARIQTDVMFAALFVLALMTVLIWTVVDRVLRHILYWAPDSNGAAR
ncbi:ABC transporter permease [Komagataeibacter rhaeticus]|mgnify:CR=1 FL=1|uniref:ABC transporter permease n=1 Tax=Komagataeibacter rhaeticus TaxID=215221 RepID=UPI0004DA1159|nr:ABC transporter permease [Komagataeibacter rhaeticus]KDU96608.1 ABC transporter permease [Komagataeibacter rhaeticus AF1]MBL7238719.1 ABC transporter permease [Komagataeibacter rhaeticus]